MLLIGTCEKKNDGWEIKRDWYSQGWIFKDEQAYLEDKNKPCYVPELSDTVYTGNDILGLCNGQEDFADDVFYELDWQCPETEIEDCIVNGEWCFCKKCGHLFDIYDKDDESYVCPNCGYDNQNEDD